MGRSIHGHVRARAFAAIESALIMKPARKSRERNLFKKCDHLWDSCGCPWLARFRGVRRVNLAKWGGVGKRKLTRSEAIAILVDVRAAINAGTFNPKGKAPIAGRNTFGDLLDVFERDYVARKRIDGKLRSTSFDCYITKFRSEFATEKMALLDQSPRRFETWLDSLTFETGPANNRTTHKLSPASWNRYYEHGRRIFNWAIAQGYATANPFVKFTKRPERNKRNTRILPEQERALFEALPKLWRNRQRTEMYRRLVAAIDLGLREGEMLKVQLKHIDFTSWAITLPPESAKGGATTDQAETVYAMTPRVRQMLEARRGQFNHPERYVFGAESGAYVASFDKSWRELFRHAGLPVGRKGGLTWHDLRHEFISFLADQGGEIHEVREAARHKDIRTTERYMKAREERLKTLMGKMAMRSA